MPYAPRLCSSLCQLEHLPKCYNATGRQLTRRFPYSTIASPNIAVLGGGITGLTTAFYLSKTLPEQARIELFEGSDRLGGWLRSTSINVGTGNVVFEAGPRSVRPGTASGLVTLDLIGELGLGDQILAVSKDSDAARNRFIYYPDHLVRMPNSILGGLPTLLSETLFDGAISGIATEAFKPSRLHENQDESVGSFISRRFGASVADNIVSALFHGIYAGDIYKLSARTILPALWCMEWKHSSIMRSLVEQALGGPRPISIDDYETLKDTLNPLSHARSFPDHIRKSSIITLRRGLQEIVTTLEAYLQKASNVIMHRGTIVSEIKMKHSNTTGARVSLNSSKKNKMNDQQQREFTHVFASISSKSLANALANNQFTKRLYRTQNVTVMVVNLFYTNSSLLNVRGFGYLLPQSLPLDQNPELALGVIFDSYATPGQDDVQGTKITVMLGGHWWDGRDDHPDEMQGARMAKAVLKRHLAIGEDPRVVKVTLQKDCIPQYHVGHHQRMIDISNDLKRNFKGRLRVVGSSYTGVGVNDCIRAAKNLVRNFHNGTGQTGLERFGAKEEWTWMMPQLTRIE